MTQNWVKRVFSTVLGVRVRDNSCSFIFFEFVLQMSITDAFLAFNLEHPIHHAGEPASFPDFLSRLAYQLIHNTFDEADFRSPRRAAVPPPIVRKLHEQHALLNLSLLSPFNGACAIFLYVYFFQRNSQIKQTLEDNAA